MPVVLYLAVTDGVCLQVYAHSFDAACIAGDEAYALMTLSARHACRWRMTRAMLQLLDPHHFGVNRYITCLHYVSKKLHADLCHKQSHTCAKYSFDVKVMHKLLTTVDFELPPLSWVDTYQECCKYMMVSIVVIICNCVYVSICRKHHMQSTHTWLHD